MARLWPSGGSPMQSKNFWDGHQHEETVFLVGGPGEPDWFANVSRLE